MMFQDARLLPWKSVIDNVGLGLKGTGGTLRVRALAAVGPKIGRQSGQPRFPAGKSSVLPLPGR